MTFVRFKNLNVGRSRPSNKFQTHSIGNENLGLKGDRNLARDKVREIDSATASGARQTAKNETPEPRDPAGVCSGDKFFFFKQKTAYDMRARDPNRKSR